MAEHRERHVDAGGGNSAGALTRSPAFVINDGGRKAAGYTRKSKRGDCVIRAIAIATELPYAKVRDDLQELSALPSDVADVGVWDHVWKEYLTELGWKCTPTMGIGTGCRVHLRADELPPGRIIAQVSVHLVAVVDGVVHDIYDPTRGGKRCVYSYWSRAS